MDKDENIDPSLALRMTITPLLVEEGLGGGALIPTSTRLFYQGHGGGQGNSGLSPVRSGAGCIRALRQAPQMRIK